MKSPWSMRNHRKSAIAPVVLVLVAGVLVSGFLLVRLRSSEGQLQDTRAWARSVLDSLGRTFETPAPPVGAEGRDSLYWQWVAISARMDSRRLQYQLREARQRRGTLLSSADVAKLREAGLEDPIVQLRDSLLARPDLVPFRDHDRPRMVFVPDKLVLLEPPHVFAYAENRHSGGYVLLAYDVRPGPRIRWRKLWWAEVE